MTRSAMAADARGDGVLADQFTREFQALVRAVVDAQRGPEKGDAPSESDTHGVAHFGALGLKLLALVRRLVDRTHDVASDTKARMLLHVGDKLAAIHEFRAADRYAYPEVVALSHGNAPRAKDELLVRAVFGQASCRVQLAKRADPFVRFPGTLERLLDALQLIQHGMQVAVELEHETPHQYAWLLLNGSVIMYSVARPMQLLGFEREVVAYLKWCLLCLESTVMLCTTKYILWRLQIYSTVCECLERSAMKRPKKATTHLQSALACAEHALRSVARLRKEEEMDLPLAKAVVATLRDAESISTALVARYRSIAKGEFFGRKAVESLPSHAQSRDRVRIAVDCLDKSIQTFDADPAARELFDFALELLQPIIQPALDSSTEDANSPVAQTLNIELPISLHLNLIRHACRLKLTEAGDQLLTAAKFRCRFLKSGDTIISELNIWEALLNLDRQSSPEVGEVTAAQRDRFVSLAQVVQRFVTQINQALPISIRDLLSSAALRLWKESAVDIIRLLEASPKPEDVDLDPRLVRQGILLIEAIYTVLRVVGFEDLIVIGEVCMRLCLLYNVDENRRKAIRTLRDFLVLVDETRDQVVDASTHFSCVSASVSNHASLSRASFSFDVTPENAHSDCYGKEASTSAFSRRSVGVEGTGSQLGSLYQELACIQVDAILLMFQFELDEAASMDAIERDITSTTSSRSITARRSSVLATITTALQKEYKKNPYARVLLNVCLLHQSTETTGHGADLVDECFKLLVRAENQERELNKLAIEPTDRSNPLGETTTPRAPRIITRSSSSVSVSVIPFKPSTAGARRRAIAYYMVFGKPAGAGTDVSLNNTDYPGTGEPLYDPMLRVTVSGLLPNTAYVFAVAAFDELGDVIQGIGETTRPVVALNPLPLVACYGYLAQACYQLKLMTPARKAAMQVYDSIVSRELERRPGWSSNFFYRHALNRNVIARWPISLLDLAVQCVLVLCDSEDGAPLRDGQLLSDGLIVRGRQVAAIEASKVIAMGLEIAGAAADFEQIRQLCFKGYRILLPILHLDDSNALTFVALSTFYQALWCIPAQAWETDTRSIASRIAFELMRIAWRHHHLADAAYSQVVRVKECSSETHASGTSTSFELAFLLDSIASVECAIGRPLAPSSADSRPLTATSTTQPPSGKLAAPPTSAASKAAQPAATSTPQATPRVDENSLPPRLSELMAQSKLNVREAFKLLEPHIKTSCNSLEIFCKLCHCALDVGDDGAQDEWMPLLKITGNLGTRCKEVLKSAGLGHLLPEPTPAPIASTSVPNTARSNAKTPRAQENATQSAATDVAAPAQSSAVLEPEFGDDDEFVLTWCGELAFIEAKVQFRQLTQYRAEHGDANCMRGPRYDYSFSVLNGETIHEYPIDANTKADGNPLSEADESSSNQEAPSLDKQDTSLEIFCRFTSRIAASCRLFSIARAWQALQTAAQLAANSIWLAWVSPDTLGRPEHATTLDNLTGCVEALLDMIEIVTATIKDEQAGKIATIFNQGSEASKHPATMHNHTLSLASTTIVVSAMSSLNIDQTWIASLIEFVIQALLAARHWYKLVQIGKKYHRLGGENTRFSEKMTPILLIAQQQYLSEQTARLESAQSKLTAFVKAFNEAEAKKKKKKSRLVVEEVLTPEEIEFRNQKGEMEHEIEKLAQERDARQRELDTVMQIHDVVSRTTNKCIQALDSCHNLVEKFRRYGESDVKPQQIVSAYQHCVALSRQKRQRRLAGKALQELGDFLWERGEVAAAVKAWNEAVDNAFNALRATSCWREIIGTHAEEQPSSSDALIEGDGLWICLESYIAIAKLALFDSPSGTPTLELARMAATTLARIVTKCSLPHPSRSFLYGSHRIFSQIWPGRELLLDSERLDAPRFAMMLIVTSEILLQYEHPVEAMPLIAFYEYLSTQCFEDADHAANAHRLRLDALVQCGRFHEAFEVIVILLTGIVMGRDEKPRQPNALIAKLQFRDDKAIKDPSNGDVLTWLGSLDIRKVLEDLKTLQFKPSTARLILVSILKLVVSLGQREPIEEEAAAILRQIASKNASWLTSILVEAIELHQQTLQQPLDGSPDLTTRSNGKAVGTWETLMLYRTRAEVLLQQSIVAASGGQWAAARESLAQSVQVATQLRGAADEVVKSVNVCLSIDANLPPALFYKPSTLIVRARLLSAKIDMVLGNYHLVVEQARTAVDEAQTNGEQAHYVHQLVLLGGSARAFLGYSPEAIHELTSLRQAFISSHSCESVPYVQLLRILACLTRDQAMHSQESSQTLHKALILLDEAEDKLDSVLRRDGWIGVDVDVALDKRMNIFQPNAAVFVELKAELVQSLMETPIEKAEDAAPRMRRALLAIDIALKATNHSVRPLAPIKARLLLQKGAILKKVLVAKDLPGMLNDDTFQLCVEALVAAIEEAIRVEVGGHDRDLIRVALMELVDLYSAKLFSGKEAEHLQAAFHYLSLAQLVVSYRRTLFDSFELQVGSLTNVDKIPAFISQTVLESAGVTSSAAAELVRATPPAKGNAPQAGQDGLKRPTVDTPRLVNFFVKILRERKLLPPCTGLQQDVAVFIHAFLVQNHSMYAKACCLQSLPAVPPDDPEIKSGMISTQWGRDQSPAFSTITKKPASPATVSLFFTLGTVRIDGHAELAESNEAVRARVELFGASPLFSKRRGLVESDVRVIGERLSLLRIDMEDEESLVVDRTKYQSRFRSCLQLIQRLLRGASLTISITPRAHPRQSDETDSAQDTSVPIGAEDDEVLDSFDVAIPLTCSLETVTILENMFHVDHGANMAIDNALCYFLRDALDN